MTELHQKVGELIGEVRGQNDKLDRVLDMIPVVAKHEEKHKDIEENWIPQIKSHETQINRIYGALKWTGMVLGGIATFAGVASAFF